MKRPINLNEHGVKIAAWAGFFLVPLPLALFLLSKLPDPESRLAARLQDAIKISAAAGLAIQAGFAILIVVEQVQDQVFDRRYRETRVKRLEAPGGFYECQFRGCQRVRPDDRQCPVCGREIEF